MVMVGDSAKDDVVMGNRAGAATILLDSGRTSALADISSLQGEMRPQFVVQSLSQVPGLLEQHFELVSHGGAGGGQHA